MTDTVLMVEEVGRCGSTGIWCRKTYQMSVQLGTPSTTPLLLLERPGRGDAVARDGPGNAHVSGNLSMKDLDEASQRDA